MRVLVVGDFGGGGVKRYAECITECISNKVECHTIGVHEPFLTYNGHSIKAAWQIYSAIKRFKPDIIHFNKLQFMMCLYVKLFPKIPRVVSLHCSYYGKMSLKDRIVHYLLKPAYYLPVSSATWEGYREHYHDARGEVLYNSIDFDSSIIERKLRDGLCVRRRSIGMAGRFAAIKDWPAFCAVAEIIKRHDSDISAIGIGVSKEEASCFGDLSEHVEWMGKLSEARSRISELGVYVMTSVSEQMPTVVLECFAECTPICGYLPDGGVREILSYSNGSLKDVFIEDRDPVRLAGIAQKLMDDEELRRKVIEDGWQILVNHFDAEKNYKERLIDIYRKVINQ